MTSSYTRQNLAHIEGTIAIRGQGAEGEHFWASVGDADLEVAISILLLEDEPHCLLDIDEELPCLEWLLVCMCTSIFSTSSALRACLRRVIEPMHLDRRSLP